ncbi:MAG TPA: VOC family protein [Candidatus Cybelea sp.]|jgi:catechol 2,3-dioxygenase-like lactoylglutathione lyase family enzyme
MTKPHGGPFRAIDHVQLAVPRGGEEKARVFYVDLLGMEEIPKPPELLSRGGIWLRSGTVLLHLGVDPEFRAATKAHPAFRCADYGALIKRLTDRGVTVVPDNHLVEGREHCYIADPFGNRIELIKG